MSEACPDPTAERIEAIETYTREYRETLGTRATDAKEWKKQNGEWKTRTGAVSRTVPINKLRKSTVPIQRVLGLKRLGEEQ